jgi:hypothetical protein
LNTQITLGYLPAGLKLVSDVQVNNPSGLSFMRTIVYGGAGSDGNERITIQVDQVPNANLSSYPSSMTPTEIRGHAGLVSSNPNQANPAVPANANPCGPTQAGQPGFAPGQATMIWVEQPGVGLQVDGTGVDISELTQVVNAITFNPTVDNCLDGNGSLTNGSGCAGGTLSSPPVESDTTLPSNGTVVGAGTATGEPWALVASTQPGNYWIQLHVNNQLVGPGNCSTGGDPATASIVTTSNLERFAVGIVPTYVTAVAAIARDGTTVSQPVLSKESNGYAYFILSLEPAKAANDTACTDAITFSFYDGNKVVYSADSATESLSDLGAGLPGTPPTGISGATEPVPPMCSQATMPNLIGDTLAQVLGPNGVLADANGVTPLYVVSHEPAGTVIAQSPAPGTSLPQAAHVTVTMSGGPTGTDTNPTTSASTS